MMGKLTVRKGLLIAVLVGLGIVILYAPPWVIPVYILVVLKSWADLWDILTPPRGRLRTPYDDPESGFYGDF